MTPAERRAALVEKVARAICLRNGIDPDDALPEEIREGNGPWPYWEMFIGDATAAITVALEEAAKVVEFSPNSHTAREVQLMLDKAAAIRALIKKGIADEA